MGRRKKKKPRCKLCGTRSRTPCLPGCDKVSESIARLGSLVNETVFTDWDDLMETQARHKSIGLDLPLVYQPAPEDSIPKGTHDMRNVTIDGGRMRGKELEIKEGVTFSGLRSFNDISVVNKKKSGAVIELGEFDLLDLTGNTRIKGQGSVGKSKR